MTVVSVRDLRLEIDQHKRLHRIANRSFISIDKTKAENAEQEWTQLDILAAEIGTNWKGGISAVRAILQGRR